MTGQEQISGEITNKGIEGQNCHFNNIFFFSEFYSKSREKKQMKFLYILFGFNI